MNIRKIGFATVILSFVVAGVFGNARPRPPNGQDNLDAFEKFVASADYSNAD